MLFILLQEAGVVTTALADCCCVELVLCDVDGADATGADELEGFEFVLLLGEDEVAALLLAFVADDALRTCSGINTLCRFGLEDNSKITIYINLLTLYKILFG